MDNSENFITYQQLEKAISIPVSDISEYLDTYVYYRGLVRTETGEVIFVDGYFIVGETELSFPRMTADDIDYYTAEPDIEPIESVIDLKGCEYCNKDSLQGKSVTPKSSLELTEALYSLKQLSHLMEKLGCPKLNDFDTTEKKRFSYDVNLVNQKSNFTLNDAAKIAANIYTTPPSKNEHSTTPYLFTHYLELLSDCVKGTNQHKFKLHTVELWCEYIDEFGESYSRQYDNGIYLKQRATIDCELTIISKQEFVRWCDYANVETGLTYVFEFPVESIEALQCENEKLLDEIRLLKSVGPCSSSSEKEVETKIQKYPPLLQLAIDAYEKYVMNSKSDLTNADIKNWLDVESKKQEITHVDQGKQMSGLSEKKKDVIASMINGK